MYYVGIDIGTTAAKAVALDLNGNRAAKGHQGYRLKTDGAKIEQDPADWTNGLCAAVRQLLQRIPAEEVAAVSLSTQGASTLAVDARGRPLCDAWTWMDGRCVAEAEALAQRLGGEYVYRATGWPASPSLDAAKIMRMQRELGARNGMRFWSTLEYCNHFLTGNAAIDPSNASIRNLCNLETGRWDERILEAAQIRTDALAEIVPAGSRIGSITPQAARETGLPAGTPVYNGAHDQYCGSLGAGATREGDVVIGSGTTWAVMGISRRPIWTPSGIAPGRHLIPGLYGEILSLVGAGAALQWFRDSFIRKDFERIAEIAAQRAERTRELAFYPFMFGACYPERREDLRGAFVGLRPEHDAYDLARAILEAAAFRTRRALADLAEHGCAAQRILFTGGAARSEFWPRLVAECLGAQIERAEEADACALGAAMIAAVGSGDMDSYESCAQRFLRPSTAVTPEAGAVRRMEEKYRRYDLLSGVMGDYFDRAAKL